MFLRSIKTAPENNQSGNKMSDDTVVVKNKLNEESPLYKAFQPILISLKLAGLHYSTGEGSHKSIAYLSRVYCWLIATLSIAFLAISLLSLSNMSIVDVNLLISLSIVVSNTLCTVNILCFLVAMQGEKALANVFIRFNNLNNYGGSYVSREWLNKIINFSCLASWLLVAVEIAVTFSYDMISTSNRSSLNNTYNNSSQEQFRSQNWFSAINILNQCYNSVSWIFMSCIEILFAIILHKEFVLFARTIKSNCIKGDTQPEENLETKRKRFVEMCRLVNAADKSLRLHELACFGCNTANICLTLYTVCYFGRDIPSGSNTFGFYVFGLLSYLIDIAVACCSGILISSGVSINFYYRHFDYLFKICYYTWAKQLLHYCH